MKTQLGSATIRPAARADIPQLVDLYRQVFGGGKLEKPQELADFYEHVLFDGPWHDDEIHSLASVDKSGRINGFLGVFPRRMHFEGVPITVAVCNNYMVSVSSRPSLVAFQLLKQLFEGPQDLALAEGSTDSRKIWETLGGSTALTYSLNWARPLRPFRYFPTVLPREKLLTKMLSAGGPVLAGLDRMLAWIAPRQFACAKSHLRPEPLTPDTQLGELKRFIHRDRLQPEYSLDSLSWLIQLFSAKQSYGELRKILLRDHENRICGWFLYYARRNQVGKVLQVVAEPASINAVLAAMFRDAYEQGVVALTGGVDPHFTEQYTAEGCLFAQSGAWLLTHAKDPEIDAAFAAGRVHFTRLEGEWMFYSVAGSTNY